MKPRANGHGFEQCLSPPARGRGLKQQYTIQSQMGVWVAPRAGAWIETPPFGLVRQMGQRRPPRGGVD